MGRWPGENLVSGMMASDLAREEMGGVRTR